MHAIFSEVQNEHAPKRFLRHGAVTDHPESPQRIRRLIVGAGAGGVTTEDFTVMARTIAAIGPLAVLVREGGRVTTVLGDSLAAFLSVFRRTR